MKFLAAHEVAVLDAVAARLIPTDQHGPGAREANVVRYIQRALAGPYHAHLADYANGLQAVDRYAASSHGKGFCELTPERQDAVLRAMEEGRAPGCGQFFELVRTHVLEGMFGDPSWGGNADYVGWDLLGFPGVRRVWTEEEQRLDVEVAPAHAGIADLRESLEEDR